MQLLGIFNVSFKDVWIRWGITQYFCHYFHQKLLQFLVKSKVFLPSFKTIHWKFVCIAYPHQFFTSQYMRYDYSLLELLSSLICHTFVNHWFHLIPAASSILTSITNSGMLSMLFLVLEDHGKGQFHEFKCICCRRLWIKLLGIAYCPAHPD